MRGPAIGIALQRVFAYSLRPEPRTVRLTRPSASFLLAGA